MPTWLIITLASLSALYLWGVIRVHWRRARVRRFLVERGIAFETTEHPVMYGWPTYHVRFRTVEEAETFRASPEFEELIAEVARLHRRNSKFDARAAVEVSSSKLST